MKPQIVNYYSGWLAPFNLAFAQDAYADGVSTFVEMQPANCGGCADGRDPALTSIANGEYDGYLTSFGREIREFGHPVLLTFAHEMNANWYPWGEGGTEKATPAQWVAAWDHVVTVISAAAPGFVDWVWAPNIERHAGSVVPYWPGDRYVDMVGLDGYLRSDSDTFRSAFGKTVADIRTLTTRPIWIAETGVYIDATTASRLRAYVEAVRAAGILGFLYFDTKGYVLRPADLASLASALNSAG